MNRQALLAMKKNPNDCANASSAILVNGTMGKWQFNSLLVSPGLLITFANSLDPDQARHFVGPDLGPICLTL